jgi:hypothetical protein
VREVLGGKPESIVISSDSSSQVKLHLSTIRSAAHCQQHFSTLSHFRRGWCGGDWFQHKGRKYVKTDRSCDYASIFLVPWSGVRLTPVGTSASIWPVVPATYERGTVAGMRNGRGNKSTRRIPAPLPFCPPQIPHDLNWARTRSAAVGSRQLPIWAMVMSCACVTRSGTLHRCNLCMTLYQPQSLLPIFCYLTNCDMETRQKAATVSTSRHYLRICMERHRKMTETNKMVGLRSETRN